MCAMLYVIYYLSRFAIKILHAFAAKRSIARTSRSRSRFMIFINELDGNFVKLGFKTLDVF